VSVCHYLFYFYLVFTKFYYTGVHLITVKDRLLQCWQIKLTAVYSAGYIIIIYYENRMLLVYCCIMDSCSMQQNLEQDLQWTASSLCHWNQKLIQCTQDSVAFVFELHTWLIAS